VGGGGVSAQKERGNYELRHRGLTHGADLKVENYDKRNDIPTEEKETNNGKKRRIFRVTSKMHEPTSFIAGVHE